jgi:hypothetical protein
LIGSDADLMIVRDDAEINARQANHSGHFRNPRLGACSMLSEHDQLGEAAPLGRSSVAFDVARCSHGRTHFLFEYAKTGLTSILSVVLCCLFLWGPPFPANIFGAGLYFALFAFLLVMITRFDYAWIEVGAESIRAKHLYFPKIIERRIDEIKELRPILCSGKVKSVQVVFWNVRLPFTTIGIDMSMYNASEIIEILKARLSAIEKQVVGVRDAEVSFKVHSTNICDPRDT